MQWTFLTNHAAVLTLMAKYPGISAPNIAKEIGITERAVRKIMADLLKEQYISRTKEGRRVIYSLHTEKPLRHQSLQKIAVGELIKVLNWEQKI